MLAIAPTIDSLATINSSDRCGSGFGRFAKSLLACVYLLSARLAGMPAYTGKRWRVRPLSVHHALVSRFSPVNSSGLVRRSYWTVCRRPPTTNTTINHLVKLAT